MKSITLHNIDDRVYLKIQRLAEEQETSLNKTIKDIIRQFFGFTSSIDHVDHHDSFKEFLGLWSEKEYKDFNKIINDARTIDPVLIRDLFTAITLFTKSLERLITFTYPYLCWANCTLASPRKKRLRKTGNPNSDKRCLDWGTHD